MKKLLIIAALMLATVVSVASCNNTPDDPAVTTDGETTTKVEDVTTVKPEDDTTVAPETDPVTEPATEPVTEPVTEPETKPQGLAGDVIAYLPLDKKVGNKIDNSVIAPKKAGDPDFQAGLKSAAFATGGTGYINLGDTWTPNNDSFAVGMWVKGTTNNGQVCLLANMSWGPEDTGFVFVWYQHQDEVRAVFNFDGVKVDKRFNVPDDYMNRWMYVVMVVDREANQVKMSFDLNEFQVHDLSYSKDTNFNSFELQDGMRPIAIGNDGIGGRSVPNGNLIDEVLVFDKAISYDEILEIGKFYKAEPAQKMDSAADLLNEQFKNAGRNQTDVADVQKDGDLEFVRLTATGGDPNVMLRGTGRNIGTMANRVNAKFIAIKYRTNDATNGRFFVGSAGGPSGSGDNFAVDWNADGKWHVAILDLAVTGISSVKDDVLHYIRMDYFDGQAAEGAYFDVAGVGYYATADDAAKAFGIAVADATVTERDNAYRMSIDGSFYAKSDKTKINLTVYGAGTDVVKVWEKKALDADKEAAPIATLGFDVLKSGEANDLVTLLGNKLVGDKSYVVKLFRDNKSVKEVSFKYSANNPSVSIGEKKIFNYGEIIDIDFVGGDAKCWIGIGPAGSSYSNYIYTADKFETDVTVQDIIAGGKHLKAGKYVLRLIKEDGGWDDKAKLLQEISFIIVDEKKPANVFFDLSWNTKEVDGAEEGKKVTVVDETKIATIEKKNDAKNQMTYIHIVPSDKDSFITGARSNFVGARYIVVRYRTNIAGDLQIKMASDEKTTEKNALAADLTANGEWITAVIDAQQLITDKAFDGYNVAYFDIGVKADAITDKSYIDIEYVGFFHSTEVADLYVPVIDFVHNWEKIGEDGKVVTEKVDGKDVPVIESSATVKGVGTVMDKKDNTKEDAASKAANAIDDKADTAWVADVKADEAGLIIDLGAVRDITKIDINFKAATYTYKVYVAESLEVAPTEITAENLADKVPAAGVNTLELADGISGQYVIIVRGEANDTIEQAFAINEVAVYGPRA